MVVVEPNYHILLLAPAGPVEPERVTHMYIPQITSTSTILQGVIDRQGLDTEKTWGLFDTRHPNDSIDTTTYPYLISYHGYRPSNNDVDFEFEIKEVV